MKVVRRGKIYMPRPIARLVVFILAMMFGVFTFQAFFRGGEGNIGVGEWAVITLMLAGIGAFILLASARKFPIYEFEFEEDEPEGRPPR